MHLNWKRQWHCQLQGTVLFALTMVHVFWATSKAACKRDQGIVVSCLQLNFEPSAGQLQWQLLLLAALLLGKMELLPRSCCNWSSLLTGERSWEDSAVFGEHTAYMNCRGLHWIISELWANYSKFSNDWSYLTSVYHAPPFFFQKNKIKNNPEGEMDN